MLIIGFGFFLPRLKPVPHQGDKTYMNNPPWFQNSVKSSVPSHRQNSSRGSCSAWRRTHGDPCGNSDHRSTWGRLSNDKFSTSKSSQPWDRKFNSKKRPISKEYKTCTGNKVFLACRRARPRLRLIRALENVDAKRVKRPAVFLSGKLFAYFGYSRWNSCVILKR